jgi:hypothetical protein
MQRVTLADSDMNGTVMTIVHDRDHRNVYIEVLHKDQLLPSSIRITRERFMETMKFLGVLL